MAQTSALSGVDAIEAATRTHVMWFRIYIGVLIITAILTWIVWKTGNNVQDAVKTEADARIAVAQRDAAQSRLETEKLKSLVAWREITSEQREKFKAIVKDAPKGHIKMESLSGNPEAVNFSHQIADMLRASGYDVLEEPGRTLEVGIPRGGVELTVSVQPSFAGPLQLALSAISIDAKGVLNARAGEGAILSVFGKP